MSVQSANAAAGVSASSALISLAVQWLPVVQIVAGFVAIITGAFAIAVYLRKLRE